MKIDFRKDWWWRKTTKHLVYEANHTLRAKTRRGEIWKHSIELLARDYELARRHDRKDSFPPYTANRWAARLLKDVAEPDRSKIYRRRDVPVEDDVTILDDENWGPIDGDWHFTASLAQATKVFQELFKEEQRRRKIKTAKRGQTNTSTVNVSWRAVDPTAVAHRRDVLACTRRSSEAQGKTFRRVTPHCGTTGKKSDGITVRIRSTPASQLEQRNRHLLGPARDQTSRTSPTGSNSPESILAHQATNSVNEWKYEAEIKDAGRQYQSGALLGHNS